MITQNSRSIDASFTYPVLLSPLVLNQVLNEIIFHNFDFEHFNLESSGGLSVCPSVSELRPSPETRVFNILVFESLLVLFSSLFSPSSSAFVTIVTNSVFNSFNHSILALKIIRSIILQNIYFTSLIKFFFFFFADFSSNYNNKLK